MSIHDAEAELVVARRLHALLSLAQISRERPLHDVLFALAEAVHKLLGYGDVAVNVYRPAWHDYEVVLVLGDPLARETLMHTTNSYDAFHNHLLRPELERVHGTYFLPHGDANWEGMTTTYTPDRPPDDQPDAWRPGDGIVVLLRTHDGRPLGLLSIDDPVSGTRPGDAELELLSAVSSHAGLALETAQRNRADQRHRGALEAIAGFPSTLTSGATVEDVLERACATITESLGYERAAAMIVSHGALLGILSRGFPSTTGGAAARLDLASALEALEGVDANDEVNSGCRVVHPHRLIPGLRPEDESRRNGAGPHAWQNNWLLVPMRGPGAGLVGLFVLDDPVDRLLPAPERRQELRLLADQAMSALTVARHGAELSHQAHHDAQTGLRNRRDLERMIDDLTARAEGVAVLLCDLDHFKRVNDRFGHSAGDRVIEHFSRLLTSLAREGDLAVRYGGEEFCLVLPGVGEADARRVATRLRIATPSHLAEIVEGQSVSIGIAATSSLPVSGAALLDAADNALYAAKRAGRNRCFSAVSPDTAEPV